MRLPCPRATHLLLIIITRYNCHAARSKTDLLMRLTCNKGSTNPEYKSTQQDLTEITLRRLRNAGSGIQGMALAIIKVLLHKSSFNNIHYIENFLRIIYKADTIRVEIMKLYIQHLHKLYSSFSY